MSTHKDVQVIIRHQVPRTNRRASKADLPRPEGEMDDRLTPSRWRSPAEYVRGVCRMKSRPRSGVHLLSSAHRKSRPRSGVHFLSSAHRKSRPKVACTFVVRPPQKSSKKAWRPPTAKSSEVACTCRPPTAKSRPRSGRPRATYIIETIIQNGGEYRVMDHIERLTALARQIAQRQTFPTLW